MAAQKAIDVSKHQGAINFNKAKDHGIQAVMIRLAYATSQDIKASIYVAQLLSANLPLLGGYGYATWHYKSECNGSLTKARAVMKTQVAKWIVIAKAIGMTNGCIAIDQELEKHESMGLNKGDNTLVLQEAIQLIRNAGYTPLIYASASWISSYMIHTNLDCGFWVAYYYWASHPDFDQASTSVPAGARYKPIMTALGSKLFMWQFASGGHGPAYGMSSAGLDRNWLYLQPAPAELTISMTKPASTDVTINMIKPTSGGKEYNMNTLQKGDSGQQVRVLQKLIGSGVDGIFGNKTETKLIAYQKKHNLSPDGVAGPNTWKSLLGG